MKLFNTEPFQGNLKKNHYFEGWYFKHVSHDLDSVHAFIPGISLTNKNSHAFIQVINGITGETHYVVYPLKDFKWKKDELFIQIGSSVFTENYIKLNIDDETIKVNGRLEYSNITKYPKTITSPSIMGWYYYIPFMECNHGIVSVNHTINGSLTINNNKIDLTNGKGYIEKDWGRSFPEAWIWLHSNSFSTENASLFVSIAKIPWMGSFFIGFISFLYINGKYHKFSTYNSSKILHTHLKNNTLSIHLKNKTNLLKIEVLLKGSGELKAPLLGNMSRRIKESIDSEVHVQLIDRKQNIIFEDQGNRAGLEIIEKIFEYL